MKRFILLSLFLSTLMLGVNAQRNCGSMDVLSQQLQQSPKLQEKMDKIEIATRAILSKNAGSRVDGVITIPVVVHVVYNTAAENISTAQINSQLQVLNDDFRRLNSDADGTWSQADDSQIEFCLASVDPNGSSTSGITRTSTTRTSFGTNDAVKSTSTNGVNAWPAGDYLNIWVCDIGGGILGYAQFPGGSPSTDGVVNDYRYFGTSGTATSPFDLGRTLTHEVGHYLNLRHIWGDGNCNQDDFVVDTPSSDAANYGCATGHISCSTTDMVQNYMDYSDDACMNLFTSGQKNRMRAIFEPGGARASLLNSGACGSAPAPTCTDGIQNGDETGVDCGGSTCAPCQSGCSGTEVSISITFDNYPEETSWEIRNAANSIVASGGTYGSQADGSSLTITECLADGCFDFIINDAYGDGICCSYGSGSYSVSAGGSVVASGGSFASSQTTNFCVGGTAPTCTDGVQNGNETGVDCGGPDCAPCNTCNDGVQNGNETGVDCGGPDCVACPTCSDGIQNGNETGVDCGGPDCVACPTCSDGIQNGNETGVDCGGPDCAPCNTCNDGVQNGNETGVDCGGPDCAACPTCSDGIQNGNETGVDCGGPDCAPCNSCNDGVQNGNETGVDCGGPDCAPCSTGCSGTEVGISITFDNYPEETSWVIRNATNTVVASGGTYGSQADGSTLVITECLADGCYDFIITDGYGDGICCSYGNGSYSVSAGGSVVASGGAFGASETTNFCLGGSSGPTCNDGVQNGDETGVDCGGSSCAPCNTGGCTNTNIDFNNFDSSMGIWNDGGSDCVRSTSSANAYSGIRSIRLRDNTSSSVVTTDNLNLAGYQEVTISFTYIAQSMETGEDFWLQASTDGGGSYQTLSTWAQGTDFANNAREFETIAITGNFTSTTRFRFRCDASSNSDYIYIDDVDIVGCVNSSRAGQRDPGSLTTNLQPNTISAMAIYPNPTVDMLNVNYNVVADSKVQLTLLDMSGRKLMTSTEDAFKGKNSSSIEVSNLNAGIYYIQINTSEQQMIKKFVHVGQR